MTVVPRSDEIPSLSAFFSKRRPSRIFIELGGWICRYISIYHFVRDFYRPRHGKYRLSGFVLC